MKISLLIIARNELKNIQLIYPLIYNECKKIGIDYYFIDGNSDDGSIDFFKENKINFFQQIYPGRGGAILSGFHLVKSDAYIIFSPDGNENISDLSKFPSLIKSGNDLVIASRMMNGAMNEEDIHIFKPRKWANNAFNFAINFLFNRKNYITDSINGFRAITSKALRHIHLDAIDYTIEYQMTIRCMKSNFKIYEFPTIEGQRKFGATGAPSFSTGIAFIRCLLKEIITKL